MDADAAAEVIGIFSAFCFMAYDYDTRVVR